MLTLFSAALIALAPVAATPAFAYFDNSCRLITNERQLTDESTLSVEDKAALAALREEVEDDHRMTGWSDHTPPSIYNFNSLFVALNPGLAKDQPFGTRTLIVATRINGVTYSARHPIKSPRYFVGIIASSSVVTRLVFFGETHFDIRLSGPGRSSVTNRVAINVVPFPADLEKILCDK